MSPRNRAKACATASVLILFSMGRSGAVQVRQDSVDLTSAVVVSPPDLTGREKKALTMLVEEVEKRSQIRWRTSESWPPDSTAVIAIGTASSLSPFAAGYETAERPRGADCRSEEHT